MVPCSVGGGWDSEEERPTFLLLSTWGRPTTFSRAIGRVSEKATSPSGIERAGRGRRMTMAPSGSEAEDPRSRQGACGGPWSSAKQGTGAGQCPTEGRSDAYAKGQKMPGSRPGKGQVSKCYYWRDMAGPGSGALPIPHRARKPEVPLGQALPFQVQTVTEGRQVRGASNTPRLCQWPVPSRPARRPTPPGSASRSAAPETALTAPAGADARRP